MKPLLVLRPEPGAGKTAAKARDLQLEPVVEPLFEVRSLDWSVDAVTSYDCLFITSSNSLKYHNECLDGLRSLPVLCVGGATADTARAAGFSNVRAGDGDAVALADLAADLGYRAILWLAGQPSTEVRHPDLTFDVKYTYQTPELAWTDAQMLALRRPAVALLHSPRAARRFSELVPDKSQIDIVAISEKAAMAAGPGWASVHWPDAPTDDAMLTLAAPLCRAG